MAEFHLMGVRTAVTDSAEVFIIAAEVFITAAEDESGSCLWVSAHREERRHRRELNRIGYLESVPEIK